MKELADGCGRVRSVDGSEDCGDGSDCSTASLLLDKGPKEELFSRVRKRSGCFPCTSEYLAGGLGAGGGVSGGSVCVMTSLSTSSVTLSGDDYRVVPDAALKRVLDGALDVLGVLEEFLPLEGPGCKLSCSGNISETLGFSDSGIIPRGQPNALGGK